MSSSWTTSAQPLPSSCSIARPVKVSHQRRDEQGLGNANGYAPDNPPAMLLPHGRDAEKNGTPGRQAFLIDLPADQLPPVVAGGQGAHDLGRDSRGRFAMQNAN